MSHDAHEPTPSNGGTKKIVGYVIIVLAIFLAIVFSYSSHTENAKNRADDTKCQNTDGEWVKIPTGHYKGKEGVCVKGTPPAPRTPAPIRVVVYGDPDHPPSGAVFVKKSAPIRVWMDPLKTSTRFSGPVRYCVEAHPEFCFDDVANKWSDVAKWHGMPAGNYIVHSTKEDEVYFRWGFGIR